MAEQFINTKALASRRWAKGQSRVNVMTQLMAQLMIVTGSSGNLLPKVVRIFFQLSGEIF